MLYKKHKNRFK